MKIAASMKQSIGTPKADVAIHVAAMRGEWTNATDSVVSTRAAYRNNGLIVMSGFLDDIENGRPQRVMSREFYYQHL